MKIAIASFTRNGCVWNQKLCAALKKHSCEGYALEKYGKEAGIPAIAPSLPAWTERMFQKMDAILFIGACGIAVRSIVFLLILFVFSLDLRRPSYQWRLG